jgi:hypothetical protein
MVLQFTLWDIMRMVSTSRLYLFMGGHGGIGIIGVGGDRGGVRGFGGLPGLSQCLALDRAARGRGGMGCIWVASGSTVCAFVLSMGA